MSGHSSDIGTLRLRLGRARQTVGWCEIPSAFSAEVMSRSGFDWVCVDWQHGLAGAETLGTMIQAISMNGVAPLVRVPFNEPWLIQKALDLGAFGVVVPMVNSADEARRAAQSCQYAPAGFRSFGPIRSASVIGTDPRTVDSNVLCIVMIETLPGYENV